MFNDLPRPIVFAHRGASAHAPENTLAAFELALRQGADAVELDAKLTADGQIVVIHDQTVDRTTEGKGWVKDMTLAELRKLDAGSHFDVAFRGEPIPTLEEVLKAIGRLTFINIELTNYASTTDQLPDKAVALVRRYKLSRRVMFSSFNPIALRRAHRLLPETAIGFLALPGGRGWLMRSWVGRLLVNYQTLNPEYRDITPRLVEHMHRLKRGVLTYTVNDQSEIERLFQAGVDGIFTDDPQLALQVRSGAKRYRSPSESLQP
jgi:glycerophosphoryl diester phosphodiesterase